MEGCISNKQYSCDNGERGGGDGAGYHGHGYGGSTVLAARYAVCASLYNYASLSMLFPDGTGCSDRVESRDGEAGLDIQRVINVFERGCAGNGELAAVVHRFSSDLCISSVGRDSGSVGSNCLLGAGFSAAVQEECQPNKSGIGCDEDGGACVGQVLSDRELKRERNRRNRQEKKERKKKRQAMSFDWRSAKPRTKTGEANSTKLGVACETSSGVGPLRASLESKWIAENELAVLKAKRQHAILSANDIDADVRKYRTAVCVATERNMVAIEKAHEKLKAGGNSTADDDDRVHTIIGCDTPSLSSGSISPNSSASLSEFRQLAKKNADLQDEKDRLEKALESLGLSLEAIEKRGKSVWTDNDHNHELLGELCPDGYGMDRDFCEPGKFRVC